MKTVLVEGWTGISQSYAMVNQWQLLALHKQPLRLLHKKAPFFVWLVELGFQGRRLRTDRCANKNHRESSGSETPTEVDVTYRIAFPLNIAAATSKKLLVFGSSEYQRVKDDFFVGRPLQEAIADPRLSIVTPSRWSKVGFLRAGFEEDRVVVIPHGVDIETFNPPTPTERADFRQGLKLGPDDYALLSVGGMQHNKGVELLAASYLLLKSKYPQLRLILKDQSSLYGIRGSQCLEKLRGTAFEKLMTPAALNDIIFLSGNLSTTWLRALYCAADCYVSPYRAEGFNIPPLEAAACGTPIVVTQGGSTDDYFTPLLGAQIASQLASKDGDTWLNPSLESLTELIETTMSKTSNLDRQAISAHVHQNHAWSRVAQSLHELFVTS